MSVEVRIEECAVRIRPLEERDLRRLEWEGGEDFRQYYEEEWVCHFAGTSPVLVADFHGYPIGQIVINLLDDPPVMEALRVMEPFRGMGIGTALIEEAERFCRERGYAVIQIGVNPKNTAARRLYEQLGYQAVGEPYHADWWLTDRHGRQRRQRETVQILLRRFEPDAPAYAGTASEPANREAADVRR